MSISSLRGIPVMSMSHCLTNVERKCLRAEMKGVVTPLRSPVCLNCRRRGKIGIFSLSYDERVHPIIIVSVITHLIEIIVLGKKFNCVQLFLHPVKARFILKQVADIAAGEWGLNHLNAAFCWKKTCKTEILCHDYLSTSYICSSFFYCMCS